ncbi:MAG TPA: M1 family aminopeptidase [Terracidiphilus sp.]|nr:M1 family aminopeptidase [Terracidiphilus sp.]
MRFPWLAVPTQDSPGAGPHTHFCFRRLAVLCAASALALLAALPLAAQFPQRPGLKITGYDITAELDPATHHIAATAAVTFSAPPDADEVTFGFHPALKITAITDASGHTLNAERLADGSIRVTPAAPLASGQPATWTFKYEGVLSGSEDGPIEGLKLAAIEEPITYLLYPARWFPTVGFMTDRFTAQMHIRVPQGMRVFASGSTGDSHPVTLASGKPGDQYDFNWKRPGFPGTVIAGRYVGPFTAGLANVKVWLTIAHQGDGNAFAQTANSEYDFFTTDFGQAETTRLNVVEIPSDTLPAAYAPELAAIMGAHIGDKAGVRLLANTIAHQWWGLEVSPKTLNDAWITNGMSRYAELMYLEDQDGQNALKSALQDVSAGALAYDTIPLSSAGTLPPFSPQFQSMTLEKGAMIFHMLRGEIGDKAFLATLKGALSQYTDAAITTADIEKVAEEQSQQQLLPFFAQWVNGTGAPMFTDKYAVYRLGNNKCFRTIGDITQDLDLFRMPVDLRIETDGKTVNQKIDVVGTDSQYVVDTFGRPRRISIDPGDWVLKSTPDLKVRIDILKGQQLVAQCDLVGALAAYQEALKVNPQSSLASYRIGEVLFNQRNFQASVNAYRDALRGDDDPAWTEVWSHIQIGKIFDITGQRDRAVNEYRLAVQTNDNTQGAINEARMLLSKPFKLPDTTTCQ